jgi:raffinose/stachyose/melibiose transport system substrate-binding protein
MGFSRRGRLAVAALITSGLIAACGGSDEEEAVDSASASASAPSGDEVVIVHWDDDTAGGVGDVTDQLIVEFEEANPGITIERTSRQFQDHLAAVRLAASGEDGPDVFTGGLGYSLDSDLVKAGYLEPLDDVAESSGWLSQLSDVTVAPLRFTPDGATWGEGNLYGMTIFTEFIGVFYNREKAEALGLQMPPATFGDFEAMLQTAKGRGETPIWLGNLDQWPAAHVYPMIQNQLSSAEEISGWMTGREGSTFVTPGNTEAAAKLQEWVEAGYFNEGFNGLSYDDSWSQFAEGNGVFYLSGTWINGQFQDTMGDNVGLFLMPGETADSPFVSAGGLADPWHISSKSTVKDEAKKWIEFLTSARAAQLLIENASLAAVSPAGDAGFEPGSLGAQSLEAWTQLQGGDGGTVPFLDMPTPTMGDTIFAALQSLMDGRMSPEQFVETVQADWDEFHSN